MKKGVILHIFFLFIATSNNFVFSQSEPVDTILHRAMNAAEKYNDLVEHFTAEVYTRTYMETVKKISSTNIPILFRVLHCMIPERRSLDRDHWRSPVRLSTQLCAGRSLCLGTLNARKDIEMIPFELLNINIYG